MLGAYMFKIVILLAGFFFPFNEYVVPFLISCSILVRYYNSIACFFS